MLKVAFCEHNLEQGAKQVMEELQNKYSEKFEIRVSRCLAACGDCFSSLIADVHGKLVVADTPEELLEKILAQSN